MAYQITDPIRLQEFQDLWAAARVAMGPQRDNPEVGLFSSLYNVIAEETTTVVTIPGPAQQSKVTHKPGVQENAWLWVVGV
ncbi:hypothetical protein [Ruegeria pomeroyi]|uniref:Uncharacterized protein n=1 Tax=Ruegeria pomeroyi TaxID=89184 RepID=A0A850LIP8_9RHOB|nr:hypothetical protein [Ruegeria pomeroyi]NVK97793.1 hypothetical protein [Ruegeria pomeroyi]NVL02547.1 hypothetical protein [Ruegeria pomeroyi]HCE71820.1 hypothetical protein [Ruegeria sp.]